MTEMISSQGNLDFKSMNWRIPEELVKATSTSAQQSTIAAPVVVEGVGLHTGEKVRLEIKPVAPDKGITFIRTDVEGNPQIPALVDYVSDTTRGTTLTREGVSIHTVEHIMSALAGLGIDNAILEMNGPEPPCTDGSSIEFARKILAAGIKLYEVPRRFFTVKEPVYYNIPGVHLGIYPSDEFRISYTIDFDHPRLRTQFASFPIVPEKYLTEIAAARTFCFHYEVEQMRAAGLIKGGTPDVAVVIGEEDILNTQLRYVDEPVRHKILDLVGDLALLGRPIKGLVLAIKAGHTANAAFVRKLKDYPRLRALAGIAEEPVFDMAAIRELLPHRYPFLLVDKVVYLEGKDRVIGYKNVTINEPFFTGHFPEQPVMPGVLILEAMAQVGGVLLMTTVPDPSDKLVLFAKIDKVKFRKPVVPGDRLVFELTTKKMKDRLCIMSGEAFVDGQTVAEAEFMAMLVDKSPQNP